ncbi:Fic family protein [uncultured Jannaschia sp.]|uniref:Fic family protein n=1 Tax=uncultured Jannaschia sp. TaxID=293347 RepID=UPI00345B6446
MADEDGVRHSHADEAQIVSDDLERAKKEAANGLVQAARVRDLVMTAIERGSFRLRPSTILELNRCAIAGLDRHAGNWRPGGVRISKSEHEPPDGFHVASLIEDMCDYVNENWGIRTPVHLASFVMWRLNWIHPFTDGNGRTSRATSYLVLCAKANILFPGKETIPEQIVANRRPYYDALESADRKHRETDGFPPDVVDEMEGLMGRMLARQLADLYGGAVGTPLV